MNSSSYHHRLPNTIAWLRFPLIFLIIMLHCYSVVRIPGDHNTYFKSIYPFSLWLGETGVPGFFFISGFLFYFSKKSYRQKLETRFHTLLIPYLLWNAALLIIYLTAYAVGHPQDINGKNLTDFGFYDYIRLFWDRGSYDDGNFVPLLCPLWYIRNLLIMSVLSPVIYYIIWYTREVFLIAITVWWLTTFHNAFIPQTFLFFCLGAYFSIFNINPLQFFSERKRMFLTLFSLFAFGDIFLHVTADSPVNLQIHRLAIIFNIPILFLLADYSVLHGFSSKLLTNATFIVFCVHYPIVVSLRKYCVAKFTEAPDYIHILLFFVCIAISTFVSLLFFLLLNNFFPKIKNIISGNR